jgi:lipopolysaccharide biosynthesis regulator YciM
LFKRGDNRARSARGAEALVRQGLHAALDGDLGRVETLLHRVVGVDPDDVEAYRALGRVCRDRGDLARAVAIHRALVLRRDLEPRQRIDALVDLGTSLYEAGEARRAVAAYEEALAHAPRDARALQALERLYAEQGDPVRALAMARRRGRAGGERDRAAEARHLAAIAESIRRDGRPDVARRVARRAVRRDPDSVEARLVAGELEAARGTGERALEHWLRAAVLAPDRAWAILPRLEAAYARLGRSREWLDWLRARVTRAPDDEAAWLALGRALAESGDPDAALAEVRGLLRSRPHSLAGHLALGHVLLAGGSASAGPEAVTEYGNLLDELASRLASGALGPRTLAVAAGSAAVASRRDVAAAGGLA